MNQIPRLPFSFFPGTIGDTMDAGDDSDVEEVAVFFRPFLSDEEKERWCEEGAVVEEVTEEVGEVSTSKDIKEEESLRYGSKTAGDQEAKLADLKNKEEKVSQLDHYLKEMEEIARKGGDEYQGMLEKVEEILRDRSKTAGDREAELDQLFANLKNEEEGASGVGSSAEALDVKLDQHLKEMEEIARKGGDEYQGMLEKVLQEMLDKRARDCQEEAEKELLRFAAHLIR